VYEIGPLFSFTTTTATAALSDDLQPRPLECPLISVFLNIFVAVLSVTDGDGRMVYEKISAVDARQGLSGLTLERLFGASSAWKATLRTPRSANGRASDGQGTHTPCSATAVAQWAHRPFPGTLNGLFGGTTATTAGTMTTRCARQWSE